MATKTATKVTPLSDRVVVRASEETEQMRGGLFIPDTAKEKPQQGEIVAIGPGKYEDGKLIPMTVKVGDKVLYPRRRAAPDPARVRCARNHQLT